MRHSRKIVHRISGRYLRWDLTEKKWDVWPKYISNGARWFHSARRARKEFEKFQRFSAGMREVKWLTYVNGKLAKVRKVGYKWDEEYTSLTIEIDRDCLNPVGTWWKVLLGMAKVAA